MKSMYMKLSSGRYTFILFIAIIQILYGTTDTYVDCAGLYCPQGMTLVYTNRHVPICIRNRKPIFYVGRYPNIVGAPCPLGTQANEYGNCRQRFN